MPDLGDIHALDGNMNDIRLMEKIFLVKSYATATITMLERIDSIKLEWDSEERDPYPNMLRLELLSEYAQAALREVVTFCTRLATTKKLPLTHGEDVVHPPAHEVRCFIELHIHIRRASNLTQELDQTLWGLHDGSTELPDGHEKLEQRSEDVGKEVTKMWNISKKLSHIGDHESGYDTWFRELNDDD